MKNIRLNSSLELPLIGFGTWQLLGEDCYNSVLKALDAGYRHIDTADRYGNHAEVAKALKNSGLKRTDYKLTTKLWREDLSPKTILQSGPRFLEELGVPFIDLLLIHWPNRDYDMIESLKAMEELKKQGIIKAIGVSNFTQHHLEDVLKSGVEITNNQVELRPSFNQKALRAFHQKHQITTTSYSTIKGGVDFKIDLISDLAEKYDKTMGQIVLNWAISQNIIVIPRTTNIDRIKENLVAADFEMETKDIEKLNQIPQGERLGNPDFADFNY
jgi:diketogulonate reductase-like aldo/keto reductase